MKILILLIICLIEGDGTIIVPKTERSSKGKINYPIIQIAFDSRDLPFVMLLQKKIKKKLGFGSVSKTKGVNAHRLTVNKYDGVILLVNILRGKMRSVKNNDLNNLIDWLNTRFKGHLYITRSILDESSFSGNAWLAGFIDADGHFSVWVLKSSGTCSFEVVQSSVDKGGFSKLEVIESLAKFLKTDIKTRTRKKKLPKYLGYNIRFSKLANNLVLVKCLEEYPLFSSKYLNYKDWSTIIKMIDLEKDESKKDMSKFIAFKESMNNKRINFNWDHLETFYDLYK